MHTLHCTARRALLASILMCAALAQPAFAVTWPNLSGVGPCQSTLQECIDSAAAGSTVTIGNDDPLVPDGYTAVNESIFFGKSLTLVGAAGVDAVFTPGHTIIVSSPVTGAVTVDIEHLTLRSGAIFVTHNSDTASTYTLRRLRIEETSATGGDAAIDMRAFGTGRPHFIIGDNVVHLSAGASSAVAGIAVNGAGGDWGVDVFRNHVRGTGTPLYCITVNGTRSGAVSVVDNTIDGVGYNIGLRIGQNPGSTANTLDVLDNVIVGARGPLSGEAAATIHMTNTTLRFNNNTVVNTIAGVAINRFGADSSNGRVANNLIAFNSASGLVIDSALAGSVSNGFNLVHGNGSNSFTAGSGTVTSDPVLVSLWNPRLASLASPAVDSGNGADVPSSIFGNGYDADGEARVLFTVDMGAYELSEDKSGRHASTTSNIGGDYSEIDEPMWTLGIDAMLLATPLKAPAAGTESASTIGVFQDSGSPSNWSIFHENQSALSAGREFSVFAPIDSRVHYVHTTTAGNSTANYSMLDNLQLNNHADAIAFVTHNWNAGGGAGIYHDHRIGLEYFGTHWYVRNEDLVDMAIGVSFNVVIANPFTSINALVAQVGSAPVAELKLEHPALDDSPCAAVQVTRADGNYSAGVVLDDVPFVLDYRAGTAGAAGHWFVQAVGPGSPTFPANAAFNVMVQGAQVDACRDDHIFTNGFDG